MSDLSYVEIVVIAYMQYYKINFATKKIYILNYITNYNNYHAPN